jgi:hypothetical protein
MGLEPRSQLAPHTSWPKPSDYRMSSASTLDAFINRVGGVTTSFSIELPDGEKRNIGRGEPEFHLSLRNKRALTALRSLDDANIAEAYLQGDIDLDGDMLKPFALRAELDDLHPLVTAWRFIQPFLLGQLYTNRRAIASHYDADPKLFLSFLDPSTSVHRGSTLMMRSRSRKRSSENLALQLTSASSARARGY